MQILKKIILKCPKKIIKKIEISKVLEKRIKTWFGLKKNNFLKKFKIFF